MKKVIQIVVGVLLVCAVAVGGFFILKNIKPGQDLNYSAPKSLVSDKISTGADIIVNLPKETDMESAQENIKFAPEIEGKWNRGAAENTLVYTPAEALEQGMVYQINVPEKDGQLKQFFEIVGPPKVLTVFPLKDTEALSDSKITLVFNRPMIPLTTLGETEKSSIPVELSPATDGRWKWLSTRSLQFIPSNKLISSANYTVKTLPEFTSFEGLKIDTVEHSFKTTPLRYERIDVGELIYNQPIKIYFNQPVDLEKTKKEISVFNNTQEKGADILVEYGMRETWNEEKNKYEDKPDMSVLEVFQKLDKNSRSKLWDFKNEYEIDIEKAFPLEGDIILEEKNSSVLTTTDVVKNIYATSERSPYSTKEFMDPKGTLEIEFFEEIDMGRTKLEVEKLKNVEYGKKCKEQEAGTEQLVWSTDNTEEIKCEEIQDKTKLKLTFKDNEIGLSEKFNLKLNKVVNTQGLEINPEAIEYTLYSHPKFEVKKVMEEDSEAASVEYLTICSSTPLHEPLLESEDENAKLEKIDDFLKISPEYKFRGWGSSVFVSPEDKSGYQCSPYEFQTSISYYLKPTTDYTVNLNLSDVFEQKQNKELTFTSGDISGIETNFYHMQDQYSVTTPKATKLTFSVENLPYVDMQICQVSAENMLRVLNKGMDYDNWALNQTECLWNTEKRIDIPGNYWSHNYFQVTLADYIPSEIGHYIVSFTNPNYLDWEEKQIYEHAQVTITNLSAIQKEIQNYEYSYMQNNEKLTDEQKAKLSNLYWITDIATLNPVSDATVNLYKFTNLEDYSSIGLDDTLNTNEQGIVKTDVVTNSAGAIIVNGDDSALIPHYTTDLSFAEGAYNNDRVFLYTDRPIYRPGDKVMIKGIYRTGYDNEMKVTSDKKVPLKIYDAQYNEIYNTEVSTNGYGTFNTEFPIDSGAALGKYRIDSGYQNTYFEVEEYVGAAFKVDTTLDKEEYIAGDRFKLDIKADYYFGVPVEGGNVTYSIVSQDYNFDKYTDEYFNFGNGWYDCWYECSTNDKYIARGEAKLTKDGRASISENLDFKKFFTEEADRSSKIFVVNLTVENTNGQQISTQKSFIVHAGEVYLGQKTDDYFMQENKEFNLKVKSVNTQGKPVGKSNIEGSINKVSWNTISRKEVDGSYYFRTEEKLTPVEEFKFGTDGSGNWSKNFTIKNEGEYKITLKTTDSKGNQIISSSTVYIYKTGESVYGEGEDLVQQTNDTTLDIVNDNGLLNVGDKAGFMIKNPFKQKAKALIAIERGKVFDYEIVDVNSSFYKYEFGVIDDYIPNIYASVVLLSSEPGLKFGSTSYHINVTKKELKVDVKPDKESYLPGEDVEVEINITDSEGKPVQTELSMAVVDMSVLALKGNPHKNPVKYFYAGFPLTVSTSANLKNLLHEIEIKPGKGGGGGADETKKRGDFLDTAWWQAVIDTDANGYAKVKFTLPDNLTTWQLETIGVSKDTKLGVNYKEIMTRKNLMITPLKPRFTVPGDAFKIGAKVFNQSDKYQDIKLSITSETLTLTDPKEQSFGLNQGETKTVYFNVKAPTDLQKGVHKFTLSAKSDNFEDTVEQTISITRDNTYEAVATANYTSENSASEFIYIPDNVVKDRGTIRINSSATLAVFISDGLNSLLDFAYGCSEQIASKLDAIATVKRGLNLKNIGDKFEIKEINFDGKKYTLDQIVPIGLARIYENQQSDGGFTYFKGWESNYYLTLRMITTLSIVQNAGYEVNENAITRAADFIMNKINTDKLYQYDSTVIYAAHAFNMMKNGSEYVAGLATRINENILSDEKLIKEDLDNMSLAYLALVLTENKDLFDETNKETVFATLENRLKIDARGAYLPSNSQRNWSYYESDQKNTALLLKALIADKRDNEMLGNILRWLLNSREKDGAWGSTASSLTVIDTFTDYLIWQKENESNFTLAVDLNNKKLDEFDFNADTILDQKKIEITPLDKLEIGKILPLTFTKTSKNDKPNNFYYDVDMKYYLPIENIAPRDEGFTVNRNLYSLDDLKFERPVKEARVGDILHGRLEIIVPETRNYVAVEDYLPAGAELVNFNLSTENKAAIEGKSGADTNTGNCTNGGKGCYTYNYDPNKFYPRVEEMRDDRLFLFTDHVSPGTYYYDYYIRVLIPGEFAHLPAVASEMYFPENFGRTGGEKFIVKE